MSNLARTLQDLRQERGHAQKEVERLDEAISVLEGLVGRNHAGRAARGESTVRIGRPRRRMSAAGRRRIAAAQRARWAKLKERRLQKAKRTMSASARRRIAAAQRARWAKLKADKKQKLAVRLAKKPTQKAERAAKKPVQKVQRVAA